MADPNESAEYESVYDRFGSDDAYQETLGDALGGGLGGELADMGISEGAFGGMETLGESLGAELQGEDQPFQQSLAHDLEQSSAGVELGDDHGGIPDSASASKQSHRKMSSTRDSRMPAALRPEPQSLGEDLGAELEDEYGPSMVQPGAPSGEASLSLDEAAEEARIARIEAQQEAVREELEETLRMTDLFLSKLKDRHATTLTAATLGKDAVNSSSRAADDMSGLEARAGAILRALQETTKAREAQVRELREMGLAFARPEADWQAALADVAGIGDEADLSISRSALDPEDEDTLGFAAASAGSADASALLSSDPAEDAFGTGPRRAVLPRSKDSIDGQISHSRGSQSTTAAHMNELQACTESLIASLGAMNEHAQVNRAAMNDASRKLRSLRTVLTQWRTEMDGVARSRAWIEDWEATSSSGGAALAPPLGTASASREALTPVNRRPEDIKAWSEQQLQRFEKILGDAEVKARELLKPITLPTSFDADLAPASASTSTGSHLSPAA